ncbi:uncharacterized protein LOC144026598 isoform X3 [Festucalex cinctus]
MKPPDKNSPLLNRLLRSGVNRSSVPGQVCEMLIDVAAQAAVVQSEAGGLWFLKRWSNVGPRQSGPSLLAIGHFQVTSGPPGSSSTKRVCAQHAPYAVSVATLGSAVLDHTQEQGESTGALRHKFRK